MGFAFCGLTPCGLGPNVITSFLQAKSVQR
jgi:hypothetical protein